MNKSCCWINLLPTLFLVLNLKSLFGLMKCSFYFVTNLLLLVGIGTEAIHINAN